ncbi:NAD(P)-binding protein, partial [Pseudoxanthomonas winnipegensis]|uniref:NAD(P)-binding protein n=1 Tax=Pseudoxanthomonas winnipegensis TaxID=2480810 RepID=UPI003F83A3B5
MGRAVPHRRPSLPPFPSLLLMSVSTHHLVIVGGGFAGLWAARALDDAPVRITLIDRHNH